MPDIDVVYKEADRIRIREDVQPWVRKYAADICNYLRPHVMKLTEAKTALKADDMIWMEISEARAKVAHREPLVAMIRLKQGYWFSQWEDIVELDALNDPYLALTYNREFRFWSGKPSKDRMREVPWSE